VTGLDTNVLVRYIVQDDAPQSAQATELVEALTAENPGFVSVVALIELVWVLERCYAASKEEISSIIHTLLRTKELVLENASLIQQALGVFSKTNVEFSDCLIQQSGQHAGCVHTATFDYKASKIHGMQLID
jgi:predicted nucleic-acid-binding protein